MVVEVRRRYTNCEDLPGKVFLESENVWELIISINYKNMGSHKKMHK